MRIDPVFVGALLFPLAVQPRQIFPKPTLNQYNDCGENDKWGGQQSLDQPE